jgi:hypothetical protein
MAHLSKDRIRETSVTTGSGAFTLAGALTGFNAFSSVCAVNDTFYYTIAHMSLTEWEVGLGTYSAANTLTRTTILASSNAGSAVVFSAGTKDVFITAPANKFLQIDNSGSVGSFTAGTVTAALSGNATTATTLQTARTINGVSFNGSANITVNTPNTLTMGVSGTGLSGSATFNGGTATTFTVTSNATSANTASAIVARDASGNFSAGTITASLSGNASTVTNGLYTTTNFGGDVSGTYNSIVVADNSHNHTSLTGVTSIAFATEITDFASISTTIDGSATYLDFNLTDDNNNDYWRWRFTPSGSTVYDAMKLKSSANGFAELTVNGLLTATQKSFTINHPTKEGMKLRYGSLEGPENGVYVRGKIKGKVIELPDYWTKLVDPDSITVQLTAIGKGQKLYVEDIRDNKVYISNDGLFAGEPYCFYYILAERIDVEKLQVEI